MSRLYILVFVALLFFVIGSIGGNAQEPRHYKDLGSDLKNIRWESMGGPPGGNHNYFAQDPYHPNNVYLSTFRGLYRSENKGNRWHLFWEGPQGGDGLLERTRFSLHATGLVSCK